jgi:hypothetical protein
MNQPVVVVVEDVSTLDAQTAQSFVLKLSVFLWVFLILTFLLYCALAIICFFYKCNQTKQ